MRGWLSSIVVQALVGAGCVAGVDPPPEGGEGALGGKADLGAPGSGGGAAWTVLVYGSYDTHDAGGIPSSLQDMKQKVSVDNPLVNLLYLEDPPDGPNTKLWQVGARHAEVVQDYGELHLGTPETLTQVLASVAQRYPAQHLFLDLVGHTTSAVSAFLPDYFPSLASWEDERLDYAEIREAILASGARVDVLGLSGCGTGDLEIVAAMADVAPFVVGLQEYNTGYTDVRWADSLVRNPAIEPRGLAWRLAQGIFRKGYYDQRSPGAVGAYDTSAIPAVRDALTGLSAALAARIQSNPEELVAARRAVLQMKSGGFHFLVDAADLADEIGAATADPVVQSRAAAFRLTLDDLLVAGGVPDYADEEEHADAHGVNMIFMRPGYGGRITNPTHFDEASAWPAAESSFYEVTGWRAVVTAIYERLR